MDDGDPVMEMYKAKAIVIEKEAEIEELRRRIAEMDRERQQRNQGEPSSHSREAAILKLEESNALLKQRVEQSERTLEESMRNIQVRLESVEETDKFDRIERRLEEITARLDRNEAENAHKGMDELKAANLNLLERGTSLEDIIKGGDETILLMGGMRFRDQDEILILDRKTSTWKVLNLKLPCTNSYGGSALLNGEIYIFGGNKLKKKLFKLHSQQMRWIELTEMNEERENIDNSSLVFQGCIWVFGGLMGVGAALDTVEKYCPERNEWIKMPGMSQKRFWAAAAVCNEKIIVSGGINEFLTTLKSVECFDPTSGVWTPMVDMPGVRIGHSMISDGSSLFVMGGGNGKNYFKTVWRIRPSEENAIWKKLQPMNEFRGYFTVKSLCCSTLDNKKEIYAIGGWNNGKNYLDSVEIFDGERWRHGPKLPNRCCSMSSVVIPSSLAERLFNT